MTPTTPGSARNYASRMPAGPGERRYRPTPAEAGLPEVELPRGDVTEGVVRVGATVRRPHQPQSLAVAGYLDHLERVGFPGSPRFLGRDDRGRDVLTFVDGAVAGDPPETWCAEEDLLAGVGRLLRQLHLASAGYLAEDGFVAPAGSRWGRDLVAPDDAAPETASEIVSHGDVTPQNVVVRGGQPVAFIDFDLAGPTTRLVDAYNTAMHWVPLRAPEDVYPTWPGVDQAARLRVFVDAYGLDVGDRERFVDLAVERTDRTWHFMRAAARQLGGGWARMWDAGVGDLVRRRQRWLDVERTTLSEALLDDRDESRGPAHSGC